MRDGGLDWFSVEVGVAVVCLLVVLVGLPHQQVMELLSNPSSAVGYGQSVTEVLLAARASIISHWLFALPVGIAISYVALLVSGTRRAGL